MNKVYENILTRASVRSFTDKAIERSDLEIILDAGVHAPSGMNKQSWRFTVLTTQEKIQGFAKVVREALGRDEGYNFYKPTALVIMSNDRDNHLGEADCACALENMFLMANELGIGSCWINQASACCDEETVRAMLTSFGIPANHKVYGMAALGYAAGEVVHKEKNKAVICYVD